MDETENYDWLKVGTLVQPKEETYGLKEKCLFSENSAQTIQVHDNVKVSSETIGLIVGFRGLGHTCMVIVAFGGILGGQKLAITENKLKKATLDPK